MNHQQILKFKNNVIFNSIPISKEIKNNFYSDRVKMLSLLSLLEDKEKYYLFEFLNKFKECEAPKKNLVIKQLLSKEVADSDIKKNNLIKTNDVLLGYAKSAYEKLNRLMLTEKSSFNIEQFNPFDLLKSYYVKVGFINERISAQAGSFIIFGLDKNYAVKKLVNTRNNKSLTRTIIVNKIGILSQLETLNISQKTLMPDKDHIAKQITKNIK